jgi:CheY-like chemotaxis protein
MDPTTRPRRVLLIEDEAAIRLELAELLREKGYEVLTAENGEDALACVPVDQPPSLILLDLMMPVLDGWQFRAAQLQRPDLADVPVVIITGGHDAADEAARLGAVGYLVKPFKWSALLTALETDYGARRATPRSR